MSLMRSDDNVYGENEKLNRKMKVLKSHIQQITTEQVQTSSINSNNYK